MPRRSKRRRYTLEQGVHFPGATLDEEREQVLHLEEEKEEVSSSTTCSSSLPKTSSSSSSSSSSPLLLSTPEEACAIGTPDSSLSSPILCSPSEAIEFSLSNNSADDSSSSEAEAFQPPPDPEMLLSDALDEKVTAVVQFLLSKYQMKELTTKAELLAIVSEYQDHFPLIFREVLECMQLVFGVDVREVDPVSHSYVLLNSLGLTYDGLVGGAQDVPKNGILILILSLIFLKGNAVPEEKIWKAMSVIGLYAGSEHYLYGDPQKFITEDWVQGGYLEYRWVPNSNPPCYEFLWGPRTYAETSKMEILKFLANIHGSDPSSFPLWYEEALREEAERAKAQASIATDASIAKASENTQAQ
ncbi:melanoma-associated antigen 10 [Echinops telfairi]|uniref:Melanoma-associated antigen 10 n=1 Tax=Echinops telfairi TaxID=9371 RepID=A0ABM0J644_ECHTE|nr:melanoma-associated antigen 10 [Echinops telfairi]